MDGKVTLEMLALGIAGFFMLAFFARKMQNKELIEFNNQNTRRLLQQQEKDIWIGLEELIYCETSIQTISSGVHGARAVSQRIRNPKYHYPTVKRAGDTYRIEFHPKVASKVENYKNALVQKFVELNKKEKGRFKTTSLPYVFEINTFNPPSRPYEHDLDHESFKEWASKLPKNHAHYGFINRNQDQYEDLNLIFSPDKILHSLTVGGTGSGKSEGTLARILLYKEMWGDDIEFIFCDGKESPDYTIVNKKFGVFKSVAKLGKTPGEELIEFANCIEYTWAEFERRKKIFEDFNNKYQTNVKRYIEYNKICEKFNEPKIKHLQLVIDEFGAFGKYAKPNLESLLEQNNGNIFGKIEALLAQARYTGITIHLITQRPQKESVPKKYSANIPIRFIYRLTDIQESNYVNVNYDIVKTLTPGEFLLRIEDEQYTSYLPSIGESEVVFNRYKDKENQEDFNYNLNFIANADNKKDSIQNLIKTTKGLAEKLYSELKEGVAGSASYLSFGNYRFLYFNTSSIDNDTFVFQQYLNNEKRDGDLIVIDSVSAKTQKKLTDLGLAFVSPLDLDEVVNSSNGSLFKEMIEFKLDEVEKKATSDSNSVDPTNKDTFYNSKAWKHLRLRILKRDGRVCKGCGEVNGRMHVDHIKPRSKFPELALDPNNLQVLCERCNMDKSNDLIIDFRDNRNKTIKDKVLELKASGKSYRQIAEELNISKSRVGEICKKYRSSDI